MNERTEDHEGSGSSGWSPRDVPVAEWGVAVLASILVLGMLGYTLHEALTRSERPPMLEVRPDSIVAVGTGHLLMFTVRNSGGATAAQVQIRGELSGPRGEPEQSQATIDYVPKGASRSAALQFAADPRAGRVDVRVVGFDSP